MALDWSALLKVGPDLPRRLDRGFFSVDRDVKAVDARVTAAEAALAARLATAGSVFSMVGPAGAAAPVVAYDFTRFDSTLTAGQNAAAANLSGVTAYDLTLSGTPTVGPFAAHGNVLQPYAVSGQGGAVASDEAHYLTIATVPPGLNILGALTLEWVGFVAKGVTPDDILTFFECSGPTEAEADNWNYSLRWQSGGTAWNYFAEKNAGTNISVNLLTAAAPLHADGVFHLALTRTAAGAVRLFINGQPVSAATAADPPTGGSTAAFKVGNASGASPGGVTRGLVTLGARVFNAELIAAQVLESYRRTMFGHGEEA